MRGSVVVAALLLAACGKDRRTPEIIDAASFEQSIEVLPGKRALSLKVNGVPHPLTYAVDSRFGVPVGRTHIEATTPDGTYVVDVRVEPKQRIVVPIARNQCLVRSEGCSSSCDYGPLRVLEKQTVPAPMLAAPFPQRVGQIACDRVPSMPDLFLADEVEMGGMYDADDPGADVDTPKTFTPERATAFDQFVGFIDEAVGKKHNGMVLGTSTGPYWVTGDRAAFIDLGTLTDTGEGYRWVANGHGKFIREALGMAPGPARPSSWEQTRLQDLHVVAVSTRIAHRERSGSGDSYRGRAREAGPAVTFFYRIGSHHLVSSRLKGALGHEGIDIDARIAARDTREAAVVDACVAKLAKEPRVSCGQGLGEELASAWLHRLVHAPPSTPVFARIYARPRNELDGADHELVLFRDSPPPRADQIAPDMPSALRIGPDGVTPVTLD